MDFADGAVRIYRAEKKEWKSYPLPAGWERNVMFIEEMKHFIAVARGEVDPVCPLQDGIRVSKLIEAIRTSSREERLVQLG